MQLQGQWALVTGASAGIGKDISKHLALFGCNVIVVARRIDRLRKLASSLSKSYGIQTIALACDLKRKESIDELLNQLSERKVKVSVLVNNAGFGLMGNVSDLPPGEQCEIVDVNCTALLRLSSALVPYMKASRQGVILNVSSLAAFQPGPGMAVYYATKSFVNSFSLALDFELKGTGVRCIAYCPGATESEFSSVSGNKDSHLFRNGAVDSSDDVARGAVRAILNESVGTVVPHGFFNKILVAAVRNIMPDFLTIRIAAFLNSKA